MALKEKTTISSRLEGYNYAKILEDHLDGDLNRIFNGELIYPRQFEVHLPGNHKQACNFHCFHCQGRKLSKELKMDEQKVIKLIRDIKPSQVSYYIFGGVYTEPLLNPYLLDCLEAVKKQNSHFGIHTNGSLFMELEHKKGLVSRMVSIMDQQDYVSISLDAGFECSHTQSKNLAIPYFDQIIQGISLLQEKRKHHSNPPALRICYLLNDINSSEEELQEIIRITRQLSVDSLRFSIPYAHYGEPFSTVRKYKKEVEIAKDKYCQNLISRLIQKNGTNKNPHIFYFSPIHQDVDRMKFQHCVYGYYQITLASNGKVYRCSSIATPEFTHGILGDIPDNRIELEKMIQLNQRKTYKPALCFKNKARCNRMALEINSAYEYNISSKYRMG